MVGVRHSNFEKILSAFIKRYGAEGEKQYQHWLSVMKLDETLPYGSPPKEAFNWATSHLAFAKEDQASKYYKVDAVFPWTSMNDNKYTAEELAAGTRTLIGKQANLNHSDENLPIELVDAEFEDNVSEVLARVPKDAVCSAGNICSLIDNAEIEPRGIVHVSIECHGVRPSTVDSGGAAVQCNGLVFDGLAFLTKDVLPGVPVTRIQPFEQLLECVSCQGCKSRANVKIPEAHQCQNAEKFAALEKKLAELTKPEIDLVTQLGDLRKQVDDLKTQLAATAKPTDTTSIPPAGVAGNQEPEVLSKEGYWKRFNELRKTLSKQDAFRLLAMEVFAALEKKKSN
jgi:hypothetical protein